MTMTGDGTTAIWRHGDDPVVGFAARELARCLRRMTGQPAGVRQAKPGGAPQAGIAVGLPADLGAAEIATSCPADRWDDRLVIRSVGERLLLTGSNPRSVLFAAYRWLEALGARWLRPGRDGELLPAITPTEDSPDRAAVELRDRSRAAILMKLDEPDAG